MFIINSAVLMPHSNMPQMLGGIKPCCPFYGIFMMLCGLAAGVVGWSR